MLIQWKRFERDPKRETDGVGSVEVGTESANSISLELRDFLRAGPNVCFAQIMNVLRELKRIFSSMSTNFLQNFDHIIEGVKFVVMHDHVVVGLAFGLRVPFCRTVELLFLFEFDFCHGIVCLPALLDE